ncbi:hypothetical protein L484_000825 [Morus notabilis]|uniref:Uncharacterized protein n=1 Tax=Morus notabilis TaxID=981085 RepID=W9R7Q4_9ROSA|nr:hypothetical protein L484_000825 [Morus notabilis]
MCKIIIVTPSPSSSFLFSFKPHQRFPFLTPCSSLNQTKKQKTLQKTTATPNAPPPKSFKWLFTSPKADDGNDNNGGGEAGLEGDTTVKGSILAGLLLVGVFGGFSV